MNSTKRYEIIARRIAKRSTHRTFQLAALLVTPDAGIFSAFNIRGRGGIEMKYCTHAEARVIANTPVSMVKHATLYVLRLAKRGRLASAKPCSSCQRLIKARHIKRIFYTDEQGQWNELVS